MSKSTKEQLDWMLKEYEALKQERDALKAQAERVPLTDEAVYAWWASDNGLEDLELSKIHDFTKAVRSVEAAHGINQPAGEQG